MEPYGNRCYVVAVSPSPYLAASH